MNRQDILNELKRIGWVGIEDFPTKALEELYEKEIKMGVIVQ